MAPKLDSDIYQIRFSQEELSVARAFWVPICAYLQQFVEPDGTTLDLGAGYCHFINNIKSRRKLALDINGDNLRRYAAPEVECIEASGTELTGIASGSVSTVFASNVYEHFQSREDVASSFEEVHRVLEAGGHFVVLQPNFAYCSKQYFDFFDHRLIFTHKGMVEGLVIHGFAVQKIIPRFLPYTSKGKIPASPWMVSAYLRFPLAWRILGSQMLLVACKPR